MRTLAQQVLPDILIVGGILVHIHQGSIGDDSVVDTLIDFVLFADGQAVEDIKKDNAAFIFIDGQGTQFTEIVDIERIRFLSLGALR